MNPASTTLSSIGRHGGGSSNGITEDPAPYPMLLQGSHSCASSSVSSPPSCYNQLSPETNTVQDEAQPLPCAGNATTSTTTATSSPSPLPGGGIDLPTALIPRHAKEQDKYKAIVMKVGQSKPLP